MLEKMLHHKLLTEGAQGQGVVTDRHDEASDSSSTSFSIRFALRGHITFPDGTKTEFESKWLSSRHVGSIGAGSIVPVRYDPSDRTKVVIDVVALEAKHKAEKENERASLEDDTAQKIAEADAEAARANAQDQPRLS